MGLLFERFGINPPGRVNILLDGRYQEVSLDNLPDDKLKQLYEGGCPYVRPTDAGMRKVAKESGAVKTNQIQHASKAGTFKKKYNK